MGQARSPKALATPLPAKQARSRRTRDALIAAGWKLLARHPWEEVTINDIVKTAGVSVGSFYTRFADKDAYFESLASEWVVRRGAQRIGDLQRVGEGEDYLAHVILDTYRTTLENQHFWRAALVRGAAHPAFWKPFRDLGLRVMTRVLELREAELGRPLSDEEVRHIRFAFQMANGLINNSIVNRPGPIQPGSPEFETELVRGLKAVAGVA
jgi:AcrR family transcriptional regulator